MAKIRLDASDLTLSVQDDLRLASIASILPCFDSFFRPATEICRFDSEEFIFAIPALNPADFKIVLCRDKLENLSCPQILAATGSADNKPLSSGSSFIRRSSAFVRASRTSR